MFGAVFFACATLHAEIFSEDHRFSVPDIENIMRTNYRAHPASGAFVRVKFQGDHIPEIYQSAHTDMNFEIIHANNPSAAIPICAGSAVFISF